MTLLSYSDLKTILTNTASVIRSLQPDYEDFFNLFEKHGFRAVEVIETSRWSFILPDTYKLVTAKGSNPRYFNKLEFPVSFQTIVESEQDFYFPGLLVVPSVFGTYVNNDSSYKTIYNIIVKIFETCLTEKLMLASGKTIATHIYRHFYVKRANIEWGWSIIEIANYIGEVEVQNIENYLISQIFKE